jgi:hypothetical protein
MEFLVDKVPLERAVLRLLRIATIGIIPSPRPTHSYYTTLTKSVVKYDSQETLNVVKFGE